MGTCRRSADICSAVDARIAALREALEAHRRLEEAMGRHYHNLGQAIAAALAEKVIDGAAAKDMLHTSRLANRARHAPFYVHSGAGDADASLLGPHGPMSNMSVPTPGAEASSSLLRADAPPFWPAHMQAGIDLRASSVIYPISRPDCGLPCVVSVPAEPCENCGPLDKHEASVNRHTLETGLAPTMCHAADELIFEPPQQH